MIETKSLHPSKKPRNLRKQTIFNVVVLVVGVVARATGVEVPEGFVEPIVEIVAAGVAIVNLALRKKGE